MVPPLLARALPFMRIEPMASPDVVDVARLRMTLDEVLSELRGIAGIDLADAYKPDGTLKNVHDMPPHVRKAIASIKTNELWQWRANEKIQVGVVVEVKFWSKPAALELIGRNLKAWVDKVEHSADSNLAGMLASAFVAGQGALEAAQPVAVIAAPVEEQAPIGG